ncbi:MAG: alkaline phosphatase D [Paraglaciecola sp.]|jgi:alkaline phosphatase D
MNKLFFLFILSLLTTTQVFSQQSMLQSGPMLGYSEMREVLLWVQTKETAEVSFAYWVKDSINSKPTEIFHTKSIFTKKETAFTAKIIAEKVLPGNSYNYDLYINKQKIDLDYPTTFQSQKLWQWRENPPSFTMAIGSCAYINEPKYDRPGKGYGDNYGIFEKIYEKRPDAMLWLGDNSYLREADWSTQTGIHHRYTHSRSVPEMQPLFASTHQYAIWDDHDFGPNDSDRSFIHKNKTLAAFENFWGNPTTGLPGIEGGITTSFQWNDVQFFLLDNRYFRSPNHRKTGEATILGKQQLEWLIDALATSKASFKIIAIGGQVLNPLPIWENYANRHVEERAYLLKQIAEEGIKNVIFLDGDRHHTELSKMVNTAGNTIYDLTCSPLTSGTGKRDEINPLQVLNSLVTERNFE